MGVAQPTGLNESRDQIEAALRATLSELLAGTADRVDGPIREAANRLVVAAHRGDRALADEARDQLQVEIQMAQLDARAGLESTLSFVLTRGVGLLFDGLTAGLAGIARRP